LHQMTIGIIGVRFAAIEAALLERTAGSGSKP
jgi:hypothetical protein